jgi:hypothetical protein
MFHQKQKSESNATPKRFSKTKFKHEVAREVAEVKTVKIETKTEKVAIDYHYDLPTKYQFNSKPTEVFSAILTKHSNQQTGYAQLNKGQQVTVEYFGDDKPIRMRAMDGRVGIGYLNGVKRMSFA